MQGMEKAIFFDGHEIFKEGDVGDYAIVMHRGHALVEVGGTRVGEVKEGSLIGESILINGTSARRTATVRAVGVVTAFKLTQAVVEAAFEEFPKEKAHIEGVVKIREQANKVLARPEQPAVDASSRRGSTTRHRSSAVSVRSSVDQEQMHRESSIHSQMRRLSSVNFSMQLNTLGIPLQCLSGADRSQSSAHRRNAMISADEARGDQCASFDPDSPRNMAIHKVFFSEAPESAGSTVVSHSRPSTRGCVQRQSTAEWVARRKQMIEDAPVCRARGEIGCGKLLPLVPADRGFVASKSRKGIDSPFRGEFGDFACMSRLGRAKSIYSRPVWAD